MSENSAASCVRSSSGRANRSTSSIWIIVRSAIIGRASRLSERTCIEKFSDVRRWKLKSSVGPSTSCLRSMER